MARPIRVLHVVGARPNFMKTAPVMRAMDGRGGRFLQKLVHTGQHYDEAMSRVFFEELGLRAPDVNLEVGSGSHAQQTAQVMTGMESVLLQSQPELVMVYGDVNSTVAAALVCAKLRMPVAHVEAGLRAFDRSMPEEINRIVTDQLSDLLFTPSQDGNENLLHEGIAEERIHLVGNVMIDSLVRLLPEATALPRNGFPSRYALVTLHRPSNVDDQDVLAGIVHALARSNRTVVFPVHPRTRKNLETFGLWEELWAKVKAIEPVDYLDFIALLMGASKVVTDSGGVQKEAYFFGVPCITLRDETEWIETVEDGWNALVGSEPEDILDALEKFNPAGTKSKSFGDGHAAEKIARILDKFV